MSWHRCLHSSSACFTLRFGNLTPQKVKFRIEYNFAYKRLHHSAIVNCFQIVSLTY